MKLINQLSFLGKFWQEKINKKVFRWNLIFIILQLILLFFKFNDLPVSVPLYYSLPWGETQLALASTLFLLPAFSLIVGLVNSILAVSFSGSNPLFTHLLTTFSLIFSILMFFALFRIIFLVS